MQVKKLQEQQIINLASKQLSAEARIAALEAQLRSHEGDEVRKEGETLGEPERGNTEVIPW